MSKLRKRHFYKQKIESISTICMELVDVERTSKRNRPTENF